VANEKSAKVSANGTSGNASKEAQRKARRNNRGTGAVCDWTGADSGLLRQAIGLVADAGFAITFGYTRDKGSYTVRIIGDPDAEPIYVRATEAVDVALQDIIYIYE